MKNKAFDETDNLIDETVFSPDERELRMKLSI
jgi:hypothetical protein